MTKNAAVSDAQITQALGVYAGMVDRVLSNPQRWLGLDDDPPPSAGFPARALDALRDRAMGDVTPASPQWGDQPVDRRVDWWVTRIGISAGLAAATPRFAGALADRIPLQAALGASAAGLAVCATAREHGRSTPQDWVPLLATVLFDRDLRAGDRAVLAPTEAEQELTADGDGDGPPGGRASTLGRGAQQAARTVWRLARTFYGLQSLFDERPRGNLVTRAIGKIPVIGVAGGWLDERSAIRKAARRTVGLVR